MSDTAQALLVFALAVGVVLLALALFYIGPYDRR